jgi:hypothetical protein
MECSLWGRKWNTTQWKKCQPSKSTNVSKVGIINLIMCQCALCCDTICQTCLYMRQCLTDFCCSFLSTLHLCKTNYCSNRPLLTTPLTLLCCSPCRLAKVRLNVVRLQTGECRANIDCHNYNHIIKKEPSI